MTDTATDGGLVVRSASSSRCSWLVAGASLASWARFRSRSHLMLAVNFLLLAAALFAIGVYGVIARRNAVMVLMSIELILNAVSLNLVAFSLMTGAIDGQVFALYVIAIAAAEVGVGLAMVLMIYRNRKTIALDELSEMKG